MLYEGRVRQVGTVEEIQTTDRSDRAPVHRRAADRRSTTRPGGASRERLTDAVTARGQRETSAGGVVVPHGVPTRRAARPLFLLIRDSYENWGFPKGHLEAASAPEAAALREVREETGLDELDAARADRDDRLVLPLPRPADPQGLPLLPDGDGAGRRHRRSARRASRRAAGRRSRRRARLVSYANAREVLRRAHEMITVVDSPATLTSDGAASVQPRAAAGRPLDATARRSS